MQFTIEKKFRAKNAVEKKKITEHDSIFSILFLALAIFFL